MFVAVSPKRFPNRRASRDKHSFIPVYLSSSNNRHLVFRRKYRESVKRSFRETRSFAVIKTPRAARRRNAPRNVCRTVSAANSSPVGTFKDLRRRRTLKLSSEHTRAKTSRLRAPRVTATAGSTSTRIHSVPETLRLSVPRDVPRLFPKFA